MLIRKKVSIGMDCAFRGVKVALGASSDDYEVSEHKRRMQLVTDGFLRARQSFFSDTDTGVTLNRSGA
jgi:hypothetical protein